VAAENLGQILKMEQAEAEVLGQQAEQFGLPLNI
jgi:hypothetical protein